ncbi:TM1266 family iron-only hydrogenase system putative regulator [Floccifex sp.]|uniref:TM1266 family iron-only hydrogenase system putative regulator n=1 Tax=Floccifex sp. TaxID=2815810 RepID=UPI002A764822|nr:TM1266 family iron-only hydrogenase system putative regulator [Floccifex sp.]MDD7281904.1 iron-only hydrogenase system regulator [Erysipelotrichaceae bacterium]MDY2957473.1 TM1266 family iron-only hydrogenase system putative regulator [Floccifex sp.]
MESKVALIGILVKNPDSVEQLNCILHEYSQFIIGRMGIPYKEKNVSIISIALDADMDTINMISGKIGRLHGISSKTILTKMD